MRLTYITSFMLSCLLCITACSEKTAPVKNDVQLKQPTLGDKMPTEAAQNVFDRAPITKEGAPQLEAEQDCHGKRMVTGTLEEVEGKMLKVADTFVITTDGGTSRYNPCTLPDRLKKDGVLVRFTGEILEIFPGERLMATPFRLENIVERDR